MAVMSTLGYDFSKFIAMMVYKKKTPDLSIVKRLEGSSAAKVVQTERKTKFHLSFSEVPPIFGSRLKVDILSLSTKYLTKNIR